MKKSKIIIPALAMLVMSTAATVTGTVAWFSANKNVYAEGMMVKAQAEGSLVITKGSSFPAPTDHASKTNFNDASAKALNPSTHAGVGNTEPFGQSGLVRVSNGSEINPETGSRTGSTALTYAAIPNLTDGSESDFYKDYTIFIAGDGNSFTEQDLVINFSGTVSQTPAAATSDINQAISVDFYCVTVQAALNDHSYAPVASTNYMGTLNLAGVYNTSDKTSAAKAQLRYDGTADGSGSGITINKTGSADQLAITMRVYFDGNLIETAPTGADTTEGTAYTTIPANTPKTDSSLNGVNYFYTSDGGYIDATNAPANVGGYKIVDSSNSTFRYARSVHSADLRDVLLSFDFSLSNHQ